MMELGKYRDGAFEFVYGGKHERDWKTNFKPNKISCFATFQEVEVKGYLYDTDLKIDYDFSR